MKMQADNTDTQNEQQCKQSTVLSVKHQQSIYIIIEQRIMYRTVLNFERVYAYATAFLPCLN